MEITVCKLIASLCPSERFDVSEGEFDNRISSFVTLLADETASHARGLVIESLIAFCLNYTPAIVSPMFALGSAHTHTLTLTEDERNPL